MKKKKFVVLPFQEEAKLFDAVKMAKEDGYKIHDVYTPFPVHGLDKALGLKESSLHKAGFYYGLTGLSVAFFYIGWIFNFDWPHNYGGKPHFSFPAWIPIMFELTVLFSAVGMTYTFCWLCKIAPGVKKHHFHPRATDDLLVLVIECTAHTNAEEVESKFKKNGAIDTSIQYAEIGWWWGTYNDDTIPFTKDNSSIVVA
ncbi:MAG: DUF3341 domain-containing protein [Phycisphaerales bacterium]|nr:DUF3341 domain-containing protein [Phycisphaerales bacterium]